MKFILILSFITLSCAQFIQRDPGLESKLTDLTNMKLGNLTIEEFEQKRIDIDSILKAQITKFNRTFEQFVNKSEIESLNYDSRDDFININK